MSGSKPKAVDLELFAILLKLAHKHALCALRGPILA